MRSPMERVFAAGVSATLAPGQCASKSIHLKDAVEIIATLASELNHGKSIFNIKTLSCLFSISSRRNMFIIFTNAS